MASLSFDATSVAPQAAFEPLKAGWYLAQIVESSLAPTQAGDGHYIKLVLQIIGDYNGEASNNRKVFTNINIDNPNPKAVEIAQAQLSAICHALGRLQINNTEELHMQPLGVRLKIRAADGQYEASNEVSGFKHGSEVPAPSAVNAPVAPPVAAPPVTPPMVQQPTPVAPPVAPPVAAAPPPAPVAAPPAAAPAPPVAAAPPAPAPAAPPAAAPAPPAGGFQSVPDWAQGGNTPAQ